jgi:hypothetical protein
MVLRFSHDKYHDLPAETLGWMERFVRLPVCKGEMTRGIARYPALLFLCIAACEKG